MQPAVPKEAQEFYAESLRILEEGGIPFFVGGTLAMSAYTGIHRVTKDLDVFCRPGDYPKIVELFTGHGYEVVVEDERWLAKVRSGEHIVDIIFNARNTVVHVTDGWLKRAVRKKIFGMETTLLGPTELIWSKAFVQDRYKYDGADIAHLILKCHDQIEWGRLLAYADQYWEVLLEHIIVFRFAYPSERERIPRFVLDELLARLNRQIAMPTSKMKVCLGRLLSQDDYRIDVEEWGFADILGYDTEHYRKNRR